MRAPGARRRGRPSSLPKASGGSCWGACPWARVVFTHHAMPAIRPVNHLLDNQKIIVRSHLGAAITSRAAAGSVVCYEADDLDPIRHTGWSVIATGLARLVQEP